MYPTNADGMGNFTKINYVSRKFMETNSYRDKTEPKPGKCIISIKSNLPFSLLFLSFNCSGDFCNFQGVV